MTSTITQPKQRKRKQPVQAMPLKLWQESHRSEEVRIEIIPLIDVIFCILTFFILAAVGVSRQQAISLNLPKASSGTAQMQEMLIVSLDDFGQVYVEQNPVATRRQLAQAVESYVLSRPNGLMVLFASKDARYDEVIQVLDILREVGGDRVALATLPEGQTTPLDGQEFDPSQLPTEDDFSDPTLPPGLEDFPDPNAIPQVPDSSLDPYGVPPIPDGPASGELAIPPTSETEPNLPPPPDTTED